MRLWGGRLESLALGAGSGEFGVDGSSGLARRLVGLKVPSVELPWALEAKTSLAELARNRSLVVFFYPGVKPQTSESAEVDVDTARAWAWREHEPDLETLGFMVVGVSTQSPTVQMVWASEEILDFMLLSDMDLRLADALGLPTVHVDGQRVFESLTLVVHEGRIVHVFYPVDPAHDAGIVTDWVRRSYA